MRSFRFDNRMKLLLSVATVFVLASCQSEPEAEFTAVDAAQAHIASLPVEGVPTLQPLLPTAKAEVTPKPTPKPKPKRVKYTQFATTWDWDFKKWTDNYLVGHHYTMLKAQCYQESLLNPLAESEVGAKGLCQFMDFAWGDVAPKLTFSPKATAFDPELSIQAAAFYDAKLRRGWIAPRPEKDRMNLTFASYNAGFGNILKAQDACDGANLYYDIIACLHLITGHHHK